MPDASTDNLPKGDHPEEVSLYADHKKVYPRSVKGTFRSIKTWSMWALLAIFYLTPWIRWDRGEGAPDQAILMDIDGRRGYFFNIEIWPQEVYYLTGLLVLAAIGLFFATALFGRVWCGFACFQTVYTDLFIMIERWLEGDRNKRIKLDRGPLTGDKLLRKGAKHAIWLAISFVTALALTWYANDAWSITREIFTFEAGPWVLATVGILTFTTYLFAGWAREQVCIYMCPYARFQSAMMDEHSMIVTYEAWRGNPRGKAKPGQSFEGRGHCVDCRMCVQACPTGIDIRDGAQMECIGCALCVDACNSVMDRFKLPRGLITYDSESNTIARSKGQPTSIRMFRMRTYAYIALILAVMGVMAYGLGTRAVVDVNVQRDRAPMFVTLSDGGIRNAYTFKILNMVRQHKEYELTLKGIEGASLNVVGIGDEDGFTVHLPVEPDRVGTFRVLISARPEALAAKSQDVFFILKDMETGEIIEHRSVFIGPGK